MTFGKGLRSAEDTVSIHATLAGGDTISFCGNLPYFSFLSTPPSRVATANTGKDALQVSLFLSTPPSRVATHLWDTGVHLVQVSIHATLAGGDHKGFNRQGRL